MIRASALTIIPFTPTNASDRPLGSPAISRSRTYLTNTTILIQSRGAMRTGCLPPRSLDCLQDCKKFFSLFREARISFESQADSRIFDLSIVFLAIRNFATCFSLGTLDKPDFSRSSALRLGDHSLSLPENAYKVLERSRILCTRAIGEPITEREAQMAFGQFSRIEEWMKGLLAQVGDRGARI